MRYKAGDRLVLNKDLCVNDTKTFATIVMVDSLGYLIKLLYTDGVSVEGWQNTDSIHTNWTLDPTYKFNQELIGLLKE